MLSTGLSLLEFITPGANHDTIEDLKLRLEPSSRLMAKMRARHRVKKEWMGV